MNNNLYIVLIVFLLAALACTQFYRSVDGKLFPKPEISRDATIKVYKSGGQLTLTLATEVEDTDIVLLYYYCRFPDGWRVDPNVYDVYPQDGEVTHSRPANCEDRIRIIMKAYNNFNKRTEKSDQMGWEFNLESLMKKSAHRI